MPADLPPPAVFRCHGGLTVIARYVDPTTVVLRFAGRRRVLTQAVSADGARYIGGGWQWWGKGLDKAALDRLPPGQTIAPAKAWCVKRP